MFKIILKIIFRKNRAKTLMKVLHQITDGLRTPNDGINQRYLKNWADVADKICFGRT